MKTKTLYLDVLRAVACIIVVLFHSKGLYTDDIHGVNFLISNITEAVARIGVPIFVMVSGALMLNEEYETNTVKIRNHIIKLVLFYVFWSGLYALKLLIEGSLNIWGFFTDFIKGPYHLWFIPMIIGLYLILPLLRLWVKRENKKYVEYFLIISLSFTILIPNAIGHMQIVSSAFSVFQDLFNAAHFEYAVGYVGYFILGWYMSTFEIKHTKILAGLGILGIITTFAGTVVLSRYLGKVYSLSSNFNLNVLLYAIAMFAVVKKLFENKSFDGKNYKIVRFICKHSLAIYAIHAAIVPISRGIVNFDFALWQIPIEFSLTLTVTLILAFIVKKIPFINYFV